MTVAERRALARAREIMHELGIRGKDGEPDPRDWSDEQTAAAVRAFGQALRGFTAGLRLQVETAAEACRSLGAAMAQAARTLGELTAELRDGGVIQRGDVFVSVASGFPWRVVGEPDDDGRWELIDDMTAGFVPIRRTAEQLLSDGWERQ